MSIAPLLLLAVSVAALAPAADAATPAPRVPEEGPPRIFRDLGAAEAVDAAAAEDRLLLIDFTAVWCAPCRRMDETTWREDPVVEWIEAHGLAIQVDVDDERDVAADYGVNVMPTIVAVRDGEELDRVFGYQDSGALLGWLDGLARGETSLDAFALDDETDVDARYDLAKELMRHGRDDEAGEHFLWLWQHALEHKPSFVGVRSSFMAASIADLAARHPPTREAFSALFDETHARLQAARYPMSTLWSEWRALARMGKREGDVVRWLLEHAHETDRLPTGHLRRRLAEMVADAGHLAAAGRLFEDLPAVVETQIESNAEFARMMELRGHQTEGVSTYQRANLLRFHEIALAADLIDDTERIETLIVEAIDDADTRLSLARQALDFAAVTPRHVRLAAEALVALEDDPHAADAEHLLEQLQAALEEG